MRLRRSLLCLVSAVAVAALSGCGHDSATLDVETDEPLYREGLQLERQGRTNEALAAYLRLISRRGDDAPESHLEVGVIELEDIKDPIAAIYHFRRFLQLEPKSNLAPRVRAEIVRAEREFASTLPAQHWENAAPGDGGDQVAQLEAENERLKAEIADLRGSAAGALRPAFAKASSGAAEGPDAAPAAAPSFAAPDTATPLVPVAEPPAPPAPAPVRTAAAMPSGKMRLHVVARHDTLYNLSVRYYGTGSRWRDILAANRDQLSGEHPALVVGMKLKIP